MLIVEINSLQSTIMAVSPGNREHDEPSWRWTAYAVFSVHSAYWHLIDGGSRLANKKAVWTLKMHVESKYIPMARQEEGYLNLRKFIEKRVAGTEPLCPLQERRG